VGVGVGCCVLAKLETCAALTQLAAASIANENHRARSMIV